MERNEKRHQKFRLNQKRKIESLEKETGAKITGKSQEDIEANKELIGAICRFAISGSAAHERRRSGIIRTVKTLGQLTEAFICFYEKGWPYEMGET